MTVRILHLVKTSVGASWALHQMRELVKLGVDVHVAVPPGGPLVDRYSACGASVHLLQADLPARYPWRYPEAVAGLRRLVTSINPDIVHSHFVGTTMTMRMALGRGHRIPRVFQVPGPLHLESPFFRRAELLTAGPDDYWIASCEWTRRRYLLSGIPDSRVFLSYYGTDLNDFGKPVTGKLRGELRSTGDTRIAGMVAYMYAPKRVLGQTRGIKGHEDFVDALAICVRRDPRIVGVIVGGPWNGAEGYERRLRAYAKERCSKQVVMLGTRDDVLELYPDMDVAVHPSHSENVGGAVESLLMGVPTIATKVGGFPDLVRENETGFLVPPKSPEHVAEAIFQVLDDPESARMRAARGQQLARELFDCTTTARQVRNIYSQILGGQRFCSDGARGHVEARS